MIKLNLVHLKDCLLLLKFILVYRSVCKIRAYLKNDNFKAKLVSYCSICSEMKMSAFSLAAFIL